MNCPPAVVLSVTFHALSPVPPSGDTSPKERPGADPATSVVNKYLQSWDVPNLFVVGGSAFPQNGAVGPTATIGMLACWAADGLKDYLNKPAGQMLV